MTVGDRIKKRRLELGLTADEVALELGKSRATIYRYENGEIEKLPVTVLEPLADVLHTTPAYLMGWDDDPINYEEIEENLNAPLVNGDEKNIYDFMKAQDEDAYSESPNRIIVLARHLQEIPENDRNQLIDTLESTIDIYLKAKGLK